MAAVFKYRPQVWVLVNGTLVCVNAGATAPTANNNLKDTAISHGRELTLSHVGPHSTPAGTTFNTFQTLSSGAGGVVSGNRYLAGLEISGSGYDFKDNYVSNNNNASSFTMRVSGNNNSIHHNEIDGASTCYYAIEHNGSTNSYTRNYIHHTGQALSSGFNGWTFDENYVIDIVAPDPAPYPGDQVWHVDGVIGWGSTIRVRKNKILMSIAQTGVVNIGTWSGSTANVNDLIVDDNYFAGAGYIFYLEEKESIYDITNAFIRNNDIGTDYYANGGNFGVWYNGYRPTVLPTTSGNRLVTPQGGFIQNVNWS